MAARYSPENQDVDAAARRPGTDQHQQVRRPVRGCRIERVPDDRGLPGRPKQRVPGYAEHRGSGHRAVGSSGDGIATRY